MSCTDAEAIEHGLMEPPPEPLRGLQLACEHVLAQKRALGNQPALVHRAMPSLFTKPGPADYRQLPNGIWWPVQFAPPETPCYTHD